MSANGWKADLPATVDYEERGLALEILMDTIAYDGDRLPWLDDTASPWTDEPVNSPYETGIQTRAILLILVLIFAVATGITVALSMFGHPTRDLARPSSVTQRLPPATNLIAANEFVQNHIRSDPDQNRTVAGNGEGIAPDQVASSRRATRIAPAPPRAVTVQLGAYREYGHADRGWRYLAGRFPLVQAFPKTVTAPSERTGQFYQLRISAASDEEAKALCAYVKRGGEDCFLVR